MFIFILYDILYLRVLTMKNIFFAENGHSITVLEKVTKNI